MTEMTLLQEPTVTEILSDPVTKLVMRRDGVTEEQVLRLMRRAALARQVQPGNPRLRRNAASKIDG